MERKGSWGGKRGWKLFGDEIKIGMVPIFTIEPG